QQQRQSPGDQVPLTAEEEEELIQEMLDQIKKNAEEQYGSRAPTDEEVQQKDKMLKDAADKLNARTNSPGAEQKPKPKKAAGTEAMDKMAQELAAKENERAARGTAQ